MNAAINELEITLGILENNEPINRKEGNIDQAELEAKNASEIRQALVVLKAVVEAKDPIWPTPCQENSCCCKE